MTLTQAETLAVTRAGDIWTVRIDRPEAGNALNDQVITALTRVVAEAAERARALVIEGSPHVFCDGADLASEVDQDPEEVYRLFWALTSGPFVSVAHVRGRVRGGGLGLVAAADLVVADPSATFGAPELLFGLYPALVLPFLARRVGRGRANAVALATLDFTATDAHRWGLVDQIADDSVRAVDRLTRRLRALDKDAVATFKRYALACDDDPVAQLPQAVAANRAMFADPGNRRRIGRYVAEGILPWEAE